MLYQHDTTHSTPATLPGILEKLGAGLERLKGRHIRGANPLLALPFETSDLEGLKTLAGDIRARFDCVVVVGAGGSGLSGRTLSCLQSAFAKPSLHFLENIDPHAMGDLMNNVDMAKTCFLVISKSGSTVETLSQFYVLLEHATKALGEKKAAEHFIVITTPMANNPMQEMAGQRGIKLLPHAADIGGRFSVLTNVGLLPAAIAGLDIAALRNGAAKVVQALDDAKAPQDFAPALGAATQVAYSEAGINLTVMLPYCERLSGFSTWYRQIWAESLGKAGKGTTPIRAVGTTDQHSQLQLYLDGPKDKFFTLVLQNRAGTGQKISAPVRADLEYIRNKTTGDIMAAEQKATFETLVAAGCPVRLFQLGSLNEEVMGALLMHFMLEVILTAELLAVDAFDQPAVEEGKKFARDYLLSGNL